MMMSLSQSPSRPTLSGLVVDLFDSSVEPARVGAKAASLARAAKAGFTVPRGVVITTDAFGSPVAELLREIRAAFPDPSTRFAVRSSARSEDGAAASFAGQLETFLDVGVDGLAEAITGCWASTSGLRVLRYGRDPGPVAVIVQSLVRASSAGVAFSADPRTGVRDVALVEAIVGLGDALVSGRATPESWRISGDTADVRRASDQAVLTEPIARRIGELARAMQKLFGAPQDVEWAFDGETLHLLQSRPITALPAAPREIAIEVPNGTWERDDHHGVLSPLGWAWFQPYPKEMGSTMAQVGLPIREMVPLRIGGHLYMRMVMAGPEGDTVPPRWVLWLASRLIPAMRRGNRLASEVLDGETYLGIFDTWKAAWKPELLEGIRALDVEDPSSLTNDALLERINAALELSAKGLRYHAQLHGPGFFALGKFGVFTEQELGWSPAKALSLLAGSSPKTTELHRSIESLLERHGAAALQLDPFPQTWAELHRRCAPLAEELATWLKDNRLRQLHYDPKHPSLGERPEYVLSITESVLFGMRGPGGPDAEAAGARASDATTLMSEASQRLTPQRFAIFERLLEQSRRGYALREENGVDTVSRPAGLVRHFVLELGRRLAVSLEEPSHAVYLYPEEHGPALRGELDGLRELVAGRRQEESWAEQHRGPKHYGPPPAPMPDVTAFPSGLRQMMEIFGWVMKGEVTGEPTKDGSLVGLGLGRRVVEGRARVIHRPEEISALRHGEVLVCRITSPEWSVGLGRVAAIVTDEGGVLSHPAIIAREFDVPAVLGTGAATKRISSGDRVRVDPIAGTVTVL